MSLAIGAQPPRATLHRPSYAAYPAPMPMLSGFRSQSPPPRPMMPLPAPALKAGAEDGNIDPAAVARQKEEFAKNLDEQLKEGAEKLAATMKAQIEGLHAQVAQEKTLHGLLVDQQVKQQELVLSQQYNQQLMMLTQATQRKGAELEQEATHLMLNYHQRKVEEDFVASQEAVETQFTDMQKKFAEELAKASVFPVPPPGPMAPLVPQLLPGQAPPMVPILAGKASAVAPPPLLTGPPMAPRATSFGQVPAKVQVAGGSAALQRPPTILAKAGPAPRPVNMGGSFIAPRAGRR